MGGGGSKARPFLGGREDGGTGSPPPGRMLQETYRFCSKEEFHGVIPLSWGKEQDRKINHFTTSSFSISTSLGLFLFLCPSLSFSLSGTGVGYSYTFLPTPPLQGRPDCGPDLSVCLSYTPDYRAWLRTGLTQGD